MGRVSAWVSGHPALLGLIAGLLVGQVLMRVDQPYIEQYHAFGQIPIVAVIALALGLGLAVIVVWFRVVLGNELARAAGTRELSLPSPRSLPARYAVTDPADKLVGAGLAALDLVLLLLVQATLRGPVVPLSSDYVEPARADTAFVVVVLALVLVLLVKLYRLAGPVLVLLVWWALDRVVPTAGFLTAHPAPAVKPATTRVTTPGATPARAASAPPAPQASRPELEPTVASAPSEAEATVVASSHSASADATVVSARSEPDATVVTEQADPDASVPAPAPTREVDPEATVVAPDKTP